MEESQNSVTTVASNSGILIIKMTGNFTIDDLMRMTREGARTNDKMPWSVWVPTTTTTATNTPIKIRGGALNVVFWGGST